MADNSPAALKMRQRGKIWADGRPWAKDGKRHQLACLDSFQPNGETLAQMFTVATVAKGASFRKKNNTRFECH